MDLQKIDQLSRAFRRAQARRSAWEPLWRDCYTFALPQRGHGLGAAFAPAARHFDRLFDGTATDAVEQLAASLLAELVPPWSAWFGLRPGADVPEAERGAAAERLEAIAARVQGHLDRSNFSVEMHQCFLDLATIGTAHLLFQESPPGAGSAFRFTALPAAEMYVEGDQNGQIRGHFRQSAMSLAGLRTRFPAALLPPRLETEAADSPERTFEVIEAVHPECHGFRYTAFLAGERGSGPLAEGWFETAPFMTFRWLKGAGELYGRSPVMSALPDIKTANKVVELILKNASIAVTGIWLADDDGVLNPANIRLVPGSIIPKAVGSAGLTPLQAPGRFDVSELMLGDLRGRIRHTLLADRLGPAEGPRMTATEILERSAQTARLLGAVYGRLQAELLLPLVQRALAVLARRGEIPPITVDGSLVELDYRSPLARAQGREDVQNTLLWLDWVGKLGPEAAPTLDARAASIWLGRTLGVPGELIRHETGLSPAIDAVLLAGAAAND